MYRFHASLLAKAFATTLPAVQMILLRYSGVNRSTIGFMALADAISASCPATSSLHVLTQCPSDRLLRPRHGPPAGHPHPLPALAHHPRLLERPLRPGHGHPLRHQRHALRQPSGHSARPAPAQTHHLRQVARPAVQRRLCRLEVRFSPSLPRLLPPLLPPNRYAVN